MQFHSNTHKSTCAEKQQHIGLPSENIPLLYFNFFLQHKLISCFVLTLVFFQSPVCSLCQQLGEQCPSWTAGVLCSTAAHNPLQCCHVCVCECVCASAAGKACQLGHCCCCHSTEGEGGREEHWRTRGRREQEGERGGESGSEGPNKAMGAGVGLGPLLL